MVHARRAEVELRGGLFQDFAPSVFHLQHALLPLLAHMGAAVRAEVVRPGYVPSGGGILRLELGGEIAAVVCRGGTWPARGWPRSAPRPC